jgi:protein-tyrosine phosphatase
MFGLPSALPRAKDYLVNARDVGAAAPGLATGIVIRSDAPRDGDRPPPGLKWPPRTVFDLRDDAEIKSVNHPMVAAADVRRVRILAEASVTGLMGGADTTLEELYAAMIEGPQAHGFAEVVGGIATAPAPVLVHCSAGKDRSGIAVALVLALLGASRAEIVADYVATKPNMPDVMARLVKDFPLQVKWAAQAGLSGLSGEASSTDASAAAVAEGEASEDSHGGGIKLPGFMGDIMARVTAMLDAPPEAIAVVLDVWDAHPGGAEGWYLAHGGDQETLVALRARLTGGEA